VYDEWLLDESLLINGSTPDAKTNDKIKYERAFQNPIQKIKLTDTHQTVDINLRNQQSTLETPQGS
jgi:hypothetical protein